MLSGTLQTISQFACTQSACIIITSKCGDTIVNKLLLHEDAEIQWSAMELISVVCSRSSVAQEQMLFKGAMPQTLRGIKQSEEFAPCLFVMGIDSLCNLMKENEAARATFIHKLNGVTQLTRLREMSIQELSVVEREHTIYEDTSKDTMEAMKVALNEKCSNALKLISKKVTTSALKHFREHSNDPAAQLFRNWDRNETLRRERAAAGLED